MAIEIPELVFDGIRAVRDIGAVNMLDRDRVIELCNELGHPVAAEWIQSNKRSYSQGIFNGFRCADEGYGRGGTIQRNEQTEVP